MRIVNLVFGILLAIGSGFYANGQTMHIIHWNMTTTSYEASPTIHVGDTIKWILDDDQPHSVTTSSGVESFDSGILNPGSTYMHVFTIPGKINYFCEVHPSTTGVITVKSGTSGLKDEKNKLISLYPNPTANLLFIQSKKQIDQIKVLNLKGEILQTAISSPVNIKHLPTGIYVVSIKMNQEIQRFRIVKE